jgi:hypothetical protein
MVDLPDQRPGAAGAAGEFGDPVDAVDETTENGVASSGIHPARVAGPGLHYILRYNCWLYTTPDRSIVGSKDGETPPQQARRPAIPL